MPTKKISLASVKTIKPGETFWDNEIKGFGCRCQKQSKTFILKYRNGKGGNARQYLYTIGRLGSPWTPDTARTEARRLLGQIASGENPAADKRLTTEAKNVNDAFSLFMRDGEGKKSKRTQEEYQRIYDKLVKQPLGKHRVPDIIQRDIESLHKSLSDKPTQANRLLQLLKAFFNWCETKKLKPAHTNPCSGIDKFKEKARERFLSEEEIFRLGNALAEFEEESFYFKGKKKEKIENPVTPYAAAAIRLLLLTGARRNEVLTLKWGDVDLERRLIRLQESKTGQKTIYLSAPALKVLSRIPRIEGNPFVICGKKDGSHLVNIKDPWIKIRKKAKLDDVRIHDLRHNYASVAMASGHHLKVVGALLGHSQIKTTERYAHLANDPIQAANEAVSGRIMEAMTKKAGKDKVVKLRG